MLDWISSKIKVKRNFGKSNWWLHIVPKTCFEGPVGDILRTSWRRPESTSQGTSLEGQIRTSSGRHFRTSPGLSNRIFRRRPRDAAGVRPRDTWGPTFASWDAVLCFFYNIIKVNYFLYHFIILLHLIFPFSLTRSSIVPYAYVSIESIDCNFLSVVEVKAIFLISSMKTLCLSPLKLCCIFNIDLLFLVNSLWFYLILSMSILFSSK